MSDSLPQKNIQSGAQDTGSETDPLEGKKITTPGSFTPTKKLEKRGVLGAFTERLPSFGKSSTRLIGKEIGKKYGGENRHLPVKTTPSQEKTVETDQAILKQKEEIIEILSGLLLRRSRFSNDEQELFEKELLEAKKILSNMNSGREGGSTTSFSEDALFLATLRELSKKSFIEKVGDTMKILREKGSLLVQEKIVARKNGGPLRPTWSERTKKIKQPLQNEGKSAPLKSDPQGSSVLTIKETSAKEVIPSSQAKGEVPAPLSQVEVVPLPQQESTQDIKEGGITQVSLPKPPRDPFAMWPSATIYVDQEKNWHFKGPSASSDEPLPQVTWEAVKTTLDPIFSQYLSFLQAGTQLEQAEKITYFSYLVTLKEDIVRALTNKDTQEAVEHAHLLRALLTNATNEWEKKLAEKEKLSTDFKETIRVSERLAHRTNAVEKTLAPETHLTIKQLEKDIIGTEEQLEGLLNRPGFISENIAPEVTDLLSHLKQRNNDYEKILLSLAVNQESIIKEAVAPSPSTAAPTKINQEASVATTPLDTWETTLTHVEGVFAQYLSFMEEGTDTEKAEKVTVFQKLHEVKEALAKGVENKNNTETEMLVEALSGALEEAKKTWGTLVANKTALSKNFKEAIRVSERLANRTNEVEKKLLREELELIKVIEVDIVKTEEQLEKVLGSATYYGGDREKVATKLFTTLQELNQEYESNLSRLEKEVAHREEVGEHHEIVDVSLQGEKVVQPKIEEPKPREVEPTEKVVTSKPQNEQPKSPDANKKQGAVGSVLSAMSVWAKKHRSYLYGPLGVLALAGAVLITTGGKEKVGDPQTKTEGAQAVNKWYNILQKVDQDDSKGARGFLQDLTKLNEQQLITKHISSYVNENNPALWTKVRDMDAYTIVEGKDPIIGLEDDARREISRYIRSLEKMAQTAEAVEQFTEAINGRLYVQNPMRATPQKTIGQLYEEVSRLVSDVARKNPIL
jgi:hypothetical protein